LLVEELFDHRFERSVRQESRPVERRAGWARQPDAVAPLDDVGRRVGPGPSDDGTGHGAVCIARHENLECSGWAEAPESPYPARGSSGDHDVTARSTGDRGSLVLCARSGGEEVDAAYGDLEDPAFDESPDLTASETQSQQLSACGDRMVGRQPRADARSE
jgi:hypothetical protein